MIRQIHHPSCPAGRAAGTVCICPGLGAGQPKPRRRTQLAELIAFAAMLGLMAGLPIYLLWRFTA